MVFILVSFSKSVFVSLTELLLSKSLSGNTWTREISLVHARIQTLKHFAPSSFQEMPSIFSSLTKLLFHRSVFCVSTARKVNITSDLNEPVLEENCFIRVCD
jgi:hypothetical protein